MKLNSLAIVTVATADTILGVSLLAGAALTFLKFIEEIAWSWWAVLAPFYVGLPMVLVALIGIPMGYAWWRRNEAFL